MNSGHFLVFKEDNEDEVFVNLDVVSVLKVRSVQRDGENRYSLTTLFTGGQSVSFTNIKGPLYPVRQEDLEFNDPDG